jgi:hypothetical protein
LIPWKNDRPELNPASFGDSAGTLEVCPKLSIVLAGLKTIIVGKGMGPDLLIGAVLDFPDQRGCKV